jgi:hypothetical protein
MDLSPIFEFEFFVFISNRKVHCMQKLLLHNLKNAIYFLELSLDGLRDKSSAGIRDFEQFHGGRRP